MGAEEFIRENPIESALGAMGIGFLLAQFPLRYIVAGLVQLTLLLLKPAVLLYAAVKVLQDIRLRSDAGYTAHGQSERQ